jgi:dsDNA-specific endonuclease/ATPase MutS2
VDAEPDEVTVTLRERRLSRRDRERHVEDVHPVLPRLDDDRGRLGDRRYEAVDKLARALPRAFSRGIEAGVGRRSATPS